mmetsp:Transcript_75922/g.210779  ORF Transcript_75922/g.210779 Transcript_75922/m.210779 type:complete len:268 (-) Transcript_75922:3-806(-)
MVHHLSQSLPGGLGSETAKYPQDFVSLLLNFFVGDRLYFWLKNLASSRNSGGPSSIRVDGADHRLGRACRHITASEAYESPQRMASALLQHVVFQVRVHRPQDRRRGLHGRELRSYCQETETGQSCERDTPKLLHVLHRNVRGHASHNRGASARCGKFPHDITVDRRRQNAQSIARLSLEFCVICLQRHGINNSAHVVHDEHTPDICARDNLVDRGYQRARHPRFYTGSYGHHLCAVNGFCATNRFHQTSVRGPTASPTRNFKPQTA